MYNRTFLNPTVEANCSSASLIHDCRIILTKGTKNSVDYNAIILLTPLALS